MAFPQIPVGSVTQAPETELPETSATVLSNFWKGQMEGEQQRTKESQAALAQQLEQERLGLDQQKLKMEQEAETRNQAELKTKTAAAALDAYFNVYGPLNTWTADQWNERRDEYLGKFNDWWTSMGYPKMTKWPTMDQEVKPAVPAQDFGGELGTRGPGPQTPGQPAVTREIPMPIGGFGAGGTLDYMTPEQLGVDPALIPPELYRTPLNVIERQPWGKKLVEYMMTHEPKVPANPTEAVIAKWVRDPGSLNPQETQILLAEQGRWAKEGQAPQVTESEFRMRLLSGGESYISTFDPAVQADLRSLRNSYIPNTPEYNAIHGGNTTLREQGTWLRRRIDDAQAKYSSALQRLQKLRADMIAAGQTPSSIILDPGYKKLQSEVVGNNAILMDRTTQYNEFLQQNPTLGTMGVGGGTPQPTPQKVTRAQLHQVFLQMSQMHKVNPATNKPWTEAEFMQAVRGDHRYLITDDVPTP